MFYFLLYPPVFVLARLILRVLGRLRSSGEGHVPVRGGVLLCPNHLSDCDPPVIFVTTPRRCWMVAKRELLDIRLLGPFIARFHGVFLRRGSADRASLRRIESLLKGGEPVLLFPEGQVSEDGRLQPFQPGAALLSLRTGVPIVPVGLYSTNELLPYGQVWPRWSVHPVAIRYGAPLYPQEFADLPRSKALAALTARLREEVARLSGQDL